MTSPKSVCAAEGHDLNADRTACLRCGVTSPQHFQLLKHPLVFKAGAMLCRIDRQDAELGGYRPEHQLKRPLVVGEEVCTLGPMGDWRGGKVVSLDPPTVDDGGMIWWPAFDKDVDHGWTVSSFASKRLVEGGR